MKKILAFVFLAFSLNAQSFDIKRDDMVVKFDYKFQNGVYILSNDKTFEPNVKVIIEYKNQNQRSKIEKKYNLQNAKILYAQNYIYTQSDNVVSLFKKLTKEENIQNVYPNWITKIQR